MAKQVVHSKRFGFVAGLNTEASFLTSPENTWREGQNVVPQVNGELHRRQGIDLENGYTLSALQSAANAAGLAFTTHEWDNVGGLSGVNFIVAQLGATVYFYDNFGAVVSPTSKPFGVELSEYKVANPNTTGYSPIQCASGNGKLIIVSADTTPILATYSHTSNTIIVSPLTITIRDFEGIEDGTAIDHNPTTLEDTHYYNLINQGWSISNLTAYYDATGVYPSRAQVWYLGKDASFNFSPTLLDKQEFGSTPAPMGRNKLDVFNRSRVTAAGLAPSSGGITSVNASYPLIGLVAGDDYWDGSGSKSLPTGTVAVQIEAESGSGTGGMANVTLNSFGKAIAIEVTAAGVGYASGESVVLRYLGTPTTYEFVWFTYPEAITVNISASTTVGQNIPNEYEQYRPTTSAFFAGRAWYAGMNSSKLSNWVMFSQVAEVDTALSKCYQDADPTSEVSSDLLPTDGGVIPIQEAGQIFRLMSFGNAMLVFADNGIWQINGGQGGFSALDYSVRKVSNVPCVAPSSVVEVESIVVFMGNTAIYAIQPDQSGMFLTCQPVTDMVIKSVITAIPINGKAHCKGYYLDEEKHIYWLYNDTAGQDGITNRYIKNKLLVYNTVLKAFYITTISELASNSPHILDAIVTKGRGPSDNDYIIVTNAGDNVVETLANGNQLIAAGAYVVGLNKTTKWLTSVPSGASYGFTFSDNDSSLTRDNTARWADWYSVDSVGAEDSAYILTGYDLMDGAADKMAAPMYITVHSRATETGFDSNFVVQNPSSILMQVQWDWTNDVEAGKWTTEQEVYRHTRMYVPTTIADLPSHGHPLITTKNKVRGAGKSMSVKFTAGTGKDMKLVGWEMPVIANSNV